MTASERAAAELEEFARLGHADVDPYAPPAMKASPSVSGGDDGELAIELRRTPHFLSPSWLLCWIWRVSFYAHEPLFSEAERVRVTMLCCCCGVCSLVQW